MAKPAVCDFCHWNQYRGNRRAGRVAHPLTRNGQKFLLLFSKRSAFLLSMGRSQGNLVF
jgi:hypothetical protein